MASLDFKSLSVLDSAPFLGLKLEPSKSPNALSLGLEGMPETELQCYPDRNTLLLHMF